MPTRKAQAAWRGTFRDGEGEMRLGSGAFEGAYSYRSRMEGSAPGTNPEELLAAAHAGCFSMSLARRLSADGHPPDSIRTEARVRLGREGEGYAIDRIELRAEAEVPGVEEGLFLEKAEAAKRDCAVSKALAGVGRSPWKPNWWVARGEDPRRARGAGSLHNRARGGRTFRELRLEGF